MNEVLVLNLTRFGDLIQTTPLLRRLKAAHPGARITLAAHRRFSAVLPLMRGYDRCILFDQDEVIRAMAGDNGPRDAYLALDRYVRQLDDVRYDLTVNLTANRMSAYLVSLLRADTVAGITAAESGQRCISGDWGLYLYSFLLGDSRRYNRINLVDIFSYMAGAAPDGRPVALSETDAGAAFASGFLRDHDLHGRRLVGLQLGASESDRCWPAASFAALSDRLQGDGTTRTILFGSPAEREMADSAAALMRIPPVNAVGMTGIPELFSLLKRCTLLVSNDTGTLHFAAAAATPAVMLVIGPASQFCTGPYGAGNLALQPVIPCAPCRYNTDCTRPQCRDLIPVPAVHDACRLIMKEDVPLDHSFFGVRLHRSGFASDGTLEWTPLCNADDRLEEMTRRYTRLWKSSLSLPSPPMPVHPPLFPELSALLTDGRAVTERIIAAADQTPLPVALLAELGAVEGELETRIKLLGSSSPAAAPLVDFLTLVRENITSSDIRTVARQTGDLYRQGALLAALL